MIADSPPLDGVTVLDLSRVLAGPWCTQTLADLGATVIKIENPQGGDDTRAWGPPFAGGESAYFLCANRGKKSVVVDFTMPAGQEIIRDLASQADVLVENFKAGGLEKYGLGEAQLRELNKRLIYCSISGYGRDVPDAARPGYDYVIQAEAGLMAINGEIDGPPMRVGVAVADLFTGMAATQAILAALIARTRDGVGQHIDMALHDCQIAMLANVGSAALITGEEPPRLGNGHATIVPYQVFSTSDRPIVVACGNDRQFQAICLEVFKRPDLAADPRFARNRDRVAHRQALDDILAPLFLLKSAHDWLESLRAAGVPGGEVRTVRAALASDSTRDRGMVVEVDHPTVGKLSLIGSPLKFSRTKTREPIAPPLLGQHSDEILGQLPPSSYE